LVALITIWILTLVTGQVRSTVQQVIENPRAMKMIVAASIVGPFIGVWLSLVAVRATYVGIASVLMALTPIILLPVVKWGFKERVSSRAVVGTVVAMVGVAVIFMGP
jgi:drug/metabolite transporter (DMT)-like permease